MKIVFCLGVVLVAWACTSHAQIAGYEIAVTGAQTTNSHRFESAFHASALLFPEVRNITDEECTALCDESPKCVGVFAWTLNDVRRCRVLKNAAMSDIDVVATKLDSLSYLRLATINYQHVAEGLGASGPDSLRFSNAFKGSDILFKENLPTQECLDMCMNDNNCKGVFSYRTPEKGTWRCNGLSEVSYKLSRTSLEGKSFAKNFIRGPDGFTVAALGKNTDNTGTPKRFAEAFEVNHIIAQHIDVSLDMCSSACFIEPTCQGAFHFFQGRLWRCNLLTNLSRKTVKTRYPSYSFAKSTESCLHSASITKCSSEIFFLDLLAVYNTDTFSSAGADGQTLPTPQYTMNTIGITTTYSVDGCTESCLYVNPGNAISVDKPGDMLSVRFSRSLTVFGATVYITDDDDAMVGGSVTISCGDDYSETFLTTGSSRMFLGLIFPTPVSSCMIHASGSTGNTFATIDDVTIGNEFPCTTFWTCNNLTAFLQLADRAVLEHFSTLPTLTPLDSFAMNKAGISLDISVPHVKYMDQGLFTSSTGQLAANWYNDKLVLEFGPEVNTFGGFFFCTDYFNTFTPCTWTLNCGNMLATRNMGGDPQFFGFSLSGDSVTKCTLKGNAHFISILAMVVGRATGGCSTTGENTICMSASAFRSQLASSFTENFETVGEIGTTPAEFVSTGNGITVTYGVADCAQDCLYVEADNSISNNNLGQSITVSFVPSVSAFGARIYTTEGTVTPGTWTLTCGDMTSTRTVIGEREFFGFSSHGSTFSSCTLTSDTNLFVTIDDVVVGMTGSCVYHNGGHYCDDREAFTRLLGSQSQEDFGFLASGNSSTTASVTFQDEDSGTGLLFEGSSCTEKCVAVNLNETSISVNWQSDVLRIKFTGQSARAFGADFVSLDADGGISPEVWSLVCGDEVIAARANPTKSDAFVGFLAPRRLEECYLVSMGFSSFATIDNVVIGNPPSSCSLVPGDAFLSCYEAASLLNYLTYSLSDSFDGAGQVGSAPVDYTVEGEDLSVKFSVDDCTESCLYVSPDHALSVYVPGSALKLTFGGRVTSFGARIFSSDEMDVVNPGSFTLTCGSRTQTIFANDDTLFVSHIGEEPLGVCTLVSNSPLYTNVDDITFGYREDQ